MLGPLVGYGFLAGATMRTPDDVVAPRRGLRRLLGRRGVWVAVGPWWGAYLSLALFFGFSYLENHFPRLFSRLPRIPPAWTFTSTYGFISGAVTVALVTIWSSSWLWPAS
jgi:hypothetical protein